MGKNNAPGSRNAARAATRARAAELRAIQARKEKQRTQLIAASAGLAVLLMAGGVTAAVLARNNDTIPDPTSTTGGGLNAEQVVAKATSLPASVFDAVGVQGVTPAATPKKIDGPDLKDGAKPRVLYVGAEYCPYCAMERWALVTALSRFGKFNGLGLTSSPAEPSIEPVPTFSFKDMSYASDYLAFTGVEMKDRRGNDLTKLSEQDQALFDKYASPPYVDAQAKGTIPWVLYAGKAYDQGATFDDKILQSRTASEIANALQDPASPIAKAVLGSANVKTAYLCGLTGGKPANVCTSKAVTAAKPKLAS